MKYLHNVPKTRGKQLSLICIVSHQAELVEVCEQPPGVDVDQAVRRLQVRECRREHLSATKKRERERERTDYYQDICCARIKFRTRRCKEWKIPPKRDFYTKLTHRNSVTGGKSTKQRVLGFVFWVWSSYFAAVLFGCVRAF